MTPDEMMKEGDKLYNQGSPGGAREWYAAAFAKLEILTGNRIEALEKRNTELAAEKDKLAWCYEQSEKELRTIAAMVCGTRGNILQDIRNLVAGPLPASSGPEQTKCVCHYPFPVCAGPFLARVPDDSGKVVCHYCDHPRACHTPAPAAKEVMPRSD